MQESKRAKLISSAVTIGVAVILGGAFMRYYPEANLAATRLNLVAGVSPGDEVPPPSGYDWGAHGRTLVLALHVGCPYCAASMGFYEQLTRLERAGDLKAHILVVFPDRAESVQHDMPQALQGLEILSSIDFRRLKIAGTPTVLLVGAAGEVINTWEGKLTRPQERRLVAFVQKRFN